MKVNFDSVKKYYEENGYVIVEKLFCDNDFDNILNEFEKFKDSNSLYFSQSEHNWRKAKSDVDEFGILSYSLENFTDLIWQKTFSNAGRNILQSQKVLEILQKLSSKQDFCMWQNMFFDKSTGTVDHIDSYYLDTNPMGKLIAAWFALEDSNENGGTFHVYPKSHLTVSNEWQNMNHDEFVKWSRKKTSSMKRKSIFLKKGDVLFWHPLTFHGSSSQIKQGISRKSLTAHYFPTDSLKGGGGKNTNKENKFREIKLKKQFKTYRSYGFPIYSSTRKRSSLIFSIKGFLHYWLNKNKPHTLMNRKNY